jgi:hypothetical protein
MKCSMTGQDFFFFNTGDCLIEVYNDLSHMLINLPCLVILSNVIITNTKILLIGGFIIFELSC